jgi:glycosyltransferase involved in cell wall biosynthesis
MSRLISIVVPVFNEADSLAPLHAEIEVALADAGPFEVVYVDDGSTDASVRVIETLAATRDNVRVVKLRRNFGKAAALTHGFAEVRGEVVVTMDGDRQDDPGEIPRLLAPLDRGYDLVSGWKQSRQDPLTKTLPSRFFNWTVRTTTGLKLHDFNCGLKAYRRDVVDNISIYGELHRYIPVLARNAGFAVTEEKVTHRRRTAGHSKYGWRRYMRGYLDLLTVLFLGRYGHRPQHLFGALGTLMVLLGLAIDVYLTVYKILGHPIGQRPLFVFANLLIVVGVQLFSVGLLGELLTFARAREGRDMYQVEAVIDAAAARSALEAAGVEWGTGPDAVPVEAVDGPRLADATTGEAGPPRKDLRDGRTAHAMPDDVSEELRARARARAERLAVEAERTLGGELKSGDFEAAADADKAPRDGTEAAPLERHSGGRADSD